MDCTIGWIKTKRGFILFKNRDTKKEYLKTNVFNENYQLVDIEYINRKGCWAGINKYGVGFASAKGPYRKIPKSYSSWIKFNEIGETTLKEAKSLDEAKKLYIQLYKKDKIGESANILLCDETKANLLEFCLDKIDIKAYSNFVTRTNHFESMIEFNDNFKTSDVSKTRLSKFNELFEKSKIFSGKDLIPLLIYHSGNENESICRHGNVMTIGSSIFELANRELVVYYNLNRSPCEGKFNKKIITNFF